MSHLYQRKKEKRKGGGGLRNWVGRMTFSPLKMWLSIEFSIVTRSQVTKNDTDESATNGLSLVTVTIVTKLV